MREEIFLLSSPRKFAIGVALAAALIYLTLAAAAHTPRARLNVMQFVAVLFFLIVILRRKEPNAPETFELPGTDKSLRRLMLAWAIGACVWAPMIPFYFISEDFELLSAARQAMFSSL